MAEVEECELCSSLDVEARKELSTYTSASNPPQDYVSVVYAFMYALLNGYLLYSKVNVIIYAQIVPPIGLEPILEGF